MNGAKVLINVIDLAAIVVGTLIGDSGCRGDVDGMEIKLQGSSQSGIAKLKSIGNQTEVTIEVNAGPAENDPQPVHIHFGGCAAGELGDVNYELDDIVAGRSKTVVDTSLRSLLNGDNAINLHRSYPDIAVYTACGDIPAR